MQGVFFRYSARDKADKLGINGFVRNEPDGSVYIEAEGEEESLNEFLEWCRLGPQMAVTERIDFKFNAEMKNFRNFSVK